VSAPAASFPDQLVKATAEHDGVRHTEIGGGDWLVMLGHVTDEQAAAVIRHEGYYDGFGLTDEELVADLNRTWARLLTSCPNHAKETDGCEFCEAQVSPERWWLDRDGGESKQNEPGWFPVTVWEVNA
jgi:hypothetical protein